VKIVGDAYRRVVKAEDPLTQALIENYRVWCRALGRDAWFADRSSILFDTVAAHLAYSEEHLFLEDLRLTIEDDGLTAVSPRGRPVRTATEWTDREAFQTSLVETIGDSLWPRHGGRAFTPGGKGSRAEARRS